MNISTASILGLIYVLSEAGLTLKKRAKAADSRGRDRGSLRLLWIVITLSAFLAFNVAYVFPAARLGAGIVARYLGLVLFVTGLAIRWYSIVYLGRFFTVNVAIAADHRLIDTGPYRFVRHPSYTGALMAFLGLGLCLDNWASLAVLLVPVFLVFLWRMRVEESALLQGLGAPYSEYLSRTKRLIPNVF